MKAGLEQAWRVAFTAQKQHGMRLMIGSMLETRLAVGASASFAVGLRGVLDFSFVDLASPLFLASDPTLGGYVQDGERIDVSPLIAGDALIPRHPLPD